MKLSTLLKPEWVLTDLRAREGEGVLAEMINALPALARLPGHDRILQKVLEREKLGSTSVGNHTAVPHTKLKDLREPLVALGVSRKGIDYGGAGEQPVHVIILILSPADAPIVHLQILAAAAALIRKSEKIIRDIMSAEGPQEVISTIRTWETED